MLNTYRLFLLLFFATLSQGVAVPITVSQNRKYSCAGLVSIDATSTYNNLSAPSWNPLSYNVSYPFGFSDTAVGGVVLSLIEIDTNFYYSQISFWGKVESFSQTSFLLNIFSNISYSTKRLTYRYFVFSSKYVDDYNWKFVSFISVINYYVLNFATPLNATGGVTYFIANLGLQVINPILSNYYSARYTVTLFPINNEITNITIGISQQYGETSYCKLSLIAYNTFYYHRHNFASFQSTTVQWVPYTLTYSILNQSNLYEHSLLIGFLINGNGNQVNIQVKTTIGSPDSIIIQSNIYLSYQTIVFKTYYCSYDNPYYSSQDETCYSLCSQTDQKSLTCTTNSTNGNSSSISEMGKIIGITVGCSLFFVILIIIIVVCWYKRKEKNRQVKKQDIRESMIEMKNVKQRKEKYQEPKIIAAEEIIVEEPFYRVYQSHYLNAARIAEPLEQDIGIWKERPKKHNINHECSICTHSYTFFKANCYHSFHIKCIVMWTNRKDSCPNCNREGLVQKSHRVFCRQCGMKQKWMRFADMKTKFESNTMQAEMVCNECKVDLVPL